MLRLHGLDLDLISKVRMEEKKSERIRSQMRSLEREVGGVQVNAETP